DPHPARPVPAGDHAPLSRWTFLQGNRRAARHLARDGEGADGERHAPLRGLLPRARPVEIHSDGRGADVRMSTVPDKTPANDETIEAMAASWLVQKDEGFSAGQAVEFARWCSASPKHAAA